MTFCPKENFIEKNTNFVEYLDFSKDNQGIFTIINKLKYYIKKDSEGRSYYERNDKNYYLNNKNNDNYLKLLKNQDDNSSNNKNLELDKHLELDKDNKGIYVGIMNSKYYIEVDNNRPYYVKNDNKYYLDNKNYDRYLKLLENKEQHNKEQENQESYYDYKYTYNAGPSPEEIKNVTREVINEKEERPININVNYPPMANPLNDERIVYYDTTLLQNLSGNPVDQVETDYSVIEDDTMYRSWDRYYLPGYSYFPPSKWQLPRDNALIVPKELRDEKCEVCPLVTNNSNNYLSGDILKGSTIQEFPTKEVTKYTTVNKGMNGLNGKGTKVVKKVKKTITTN